MTGPAIDLLNRRSGHMDALQVMATIPDTWSIAAISTALQTLFKSSVHNRRMTSIERSLQEADNLNKKFDEMQNTKDKLIIEKHSYCMSCKKSFEEALVARFPNGIIVCHQCVKDPKTCPVTGQIF